MVLGSITYKSHQMGDDVAQDVERSLTAMFATLKGTMPLKREYGIDPSVLDNPLSVAKTLLAEEIYTCADTYEERAQVLDVSFAYDPGTDALCPIIQYELVSDSDTEADDWDDEYEAEEDEDYEQYG